MSNTHLLRVSGAAMLILALAAPSIALWGIPAPSPSTPSTTAFTHNIEAQPQEITLTCLDAQLDPFSASIAQPLAPTTIPADMMPSSNGTLTIDTQTVAQYVAMAIPAQAGGELRGISFLPCMQPRSEHWFVQGSATSGVDTLIRVTNPSATPTNVTIALWGAAGQYTLDNHTITIPAGESFTLRPGRYAPQEERLAIRLTSDGPGIGAWMNINRMNGEIPGGSTWLPSTQLSNQHTISAITGQNSSLRVANPTNHDAAVTITWTTPEGSSELPGGKLTLAPGSVTDIPLPAAAGLAAAATVNSDRPVLAQALVRLAGQPWNSNNAATWEELNAITPVRPLLKATIPTVQVLSNAVNAANRRPIIRPTTLPTPSGLTITRTTLIAGHQHPETIMMTLRNSQGEQTFDIPSGKLTTVDLGAVELPTDDSGMLAVQASADIHLSVLLEAQTPTGSLVAALPVTAESLATASATVLLER